MATSITDMIHWARAVTCTPKSTHAAITRNQTAPTTVINAIPANTAFVTWLKEKSMYLNPGYFPSITLPLRPHPIAIPFPIALVFYFLLVIVFTYFYTAIVMNVQEMADNLKKYGNYIPGIRPGKPTLDYLERVVSRITLAGAVFRDDSPVGAA